MYIRRMRFGEFLKRLIFVLILGSAALLAGSKFYIEHRVTAFLKEITAVTAGKGELRYLNVYSSFDGRVGVEGIGYYPAANVDMAPIIIEEAVLSTPSHLYLLGLQGDGLARSMSLELKGLRVDTGSFFNMGPGTEGPSISGNPFESLACGNVDTFRSPDLANMGIQGADRVNLAINYNRLPNDSTTLSLIQNTANISSLKMLLNFNASGVHSLNLRQLPPTIELKSANLTIAAGSFSNNRNSYCAKLTDMTVEQFVEANIEATLVALLREGVQPEPGLIEQYRAFMLGSGWTLESNPGSPLAIAEALTLDSALLPNRLKLHSKLTGQQSIPFRFAQVVQLPVEEDETRVNATPLVDPATGLIPKTVTKKTPDRLVEVPISDLKLFVDTVVMIHTTSRQEYIGLVIEIADSGLRINTRRVRGNADMEIPFQQISSVSVQEFEFDRIMHPQEE
jgi:hypothetical protein